MITASVMKELKIFIMKKGVFEKYYFGVMIV